MAHTLARSAGRQETQMILTADYPARLCRKRSFDRGSAYAEATARQVVLITRMGKEDHRE